MATLNEIMEFDHVVFVDEYGHVHDHNTLTPERAGWSRGVSARTHLYAPELCDDSHGDPVPENGPETPAGVGMGIGMGSDLVALPRPHTGPVVSNSDSELQRQARAYGWDGLLTGFTGQYCYRGPIMHESEVIGGGIERYILENPGWYCAVVVNVPEEDSDTYNGNVAGWAIAYKEAGDYDGPWVDVVFADGIDYEECSHMDIGPMADHLAQWDFGQETDDAHTRDAYSWGNSDHVYMVGQYVLTANYRLGYASLNRRPMGAVVTA